MKVALLLLVAVVLTGCATAKETYTATGEKGYAIDCYGSAGNWGMCTQKAGELCGAAGYTILSKSGDQSQMITANQFGMYATPVVNRSMTIKCSQ